MKISNNTIGNRSRDFPICSAVPQPLRQRVPLLLGTIKYTVLVSTLDKFLSCWHNTLGSGVSSGVSVKQMGFMAHYSKN
jgi:hypothetical protein